MRPRPTGVLWARTGLPAGARLCQAATHDVYRRRVVRRRHGDADGHELVEVWACAVCWPPPPQIRELALQLEAAAARKGSGGLFHERS